MHTPDFSTPRLSVRPWEEADALWYVSAIDDEIVRFTRESSDLSVEAWIGGLTKARADSTATTVAIIDAEGHRVGNLGIQMHPLTVELSYWIQANARGRGYASEILAAASEWAVAELGSTSFELQIHPENIASIEVATRSGYRFAGYRESTASCADARGRVAIYARTA